MTPSVWCLTVSLHCIVCLCICIRLRVCEPFPVCSVQELNKCKRSMGEVVAVSTQAYDARQVSAQEHVSCNKCCNGDMQMY